MVMSGDVEDRIKTIELTSTEHTIINHAALSYLRFHDKYERFLHNPEIANNDDWMHMKLGYKILRKQYHDLERIVAKNFGLYSIEDQEAILYYQSIAYELDDSINDLEKDKYRYEKIMAALNAGSKLMAIALKSR